MALNFSAVGGAFKNHWEKILLLLVLLGLMASGVILFINIQGWDQQDWGIPPRGREAEAQPVDTELFAEFQNQLDRPEMQRLGDYDVFAGRKARYDRKDRIYYPIDVQKEGDDDADGMPTDWENQNNLDYQNPRDAYEDPDGDGFSNLEEFIAGTDPFDRESRPPTAAKLRLYQYGAKPFPLTLQEVMPDPRGGGVRYQVNIGGGRTEFRKLGDRVGDYLIKDFEERSQTVADPTTGEQVTRSLPVLILEKGDELIELPLKQRVIRKDPRARLLVMKRPPEILKKTFANGDTITIGGQTYKVIDIQQTEVRLQDVETSQEYVIPSFSDLDRKWLRGPAMQRPGRGLRGG